MNLKDIVIIRSEKTKAENVYNYISTENMLPNKGGIVLTNTVPNGGNLSVYKKGDVLLSNIRPYFKKIWLATHDGTASNDVIVFQSRQNIDNRYLYYVLADDNFFSYVMTGAKGTKMPRGDKKQMMLYPVFCPPLDEQKRIAEILGAFDDKIELLQKQNKTLEDMAKALFKSWFVDFDVVRAKQKGLPKADIMREYHLTDDLYDLFPSSFADSPLGPIPSGWEVVKISDVARVVGGGTPSTKQTKFFSASGTAIAWLTPKDLSGYQYKYIDHGQTDITQEGLTHSSAQLMPTNSIVFSSRAPIGYIAISLGEIATNQGFKSLVPLERHWTEFLYQYLCYNRYIIEGLGTGSTFKEVSGSVMKNISLCFPSSEILKAFEQETEIINSKQKIIMKEIQTLTELRDTLLPRLISGKIRV
ncbi:restriction endonuclease subunit S [Candidatus Avelusimicrobium fimicolum]|uniref:restriction endonuclease subunit S n=1 Tax=Candidatus Avelusimicrobium fimicolum TaxID=3416216 RepID=UPI003D14E6B2